jgi:amidase
VPATDAVGAARLANAGGVIFGKTNTPLFAGDTQTYNAVFGTTNNPWDTHAGDRRADRAAVAAAHARSVSDIGGSVRIPRTTAGYTHKPSYGIGSADTS